MRCEITKITRGKGGGGALVKRRSSHVRKYSRIYRSEYEVSDEPDRGGQLLVIREIMIHFYAKRQT